VRAGMQLAYEHPEGGLVCERNPVSVGP
jgi:hypothetical protein